MILGAQDIISCCRGRCVRLVEYFNSHLDLYVSLVGVVFYKVMISSLRRMITTKTIFVFYGHIIYAVLIFILRFQASFKQFRRYRHTNCWLKHFVVVEHCQILLQAVGRLTFWGIKPKRKLTKYVSHTMRSYYQQSKRGWSKLRLTIHENSVHAYGLLISPSTPVTF